MKSPLVIGHRGASAVAPENTLAAFRRAIEGGADGVELDVRLSRDGIPVVIHDRTLRRTGLCDGVVEGMTAEELGRVDVGSWFNSIHTKLAQQEYRLQRLPSLDEVLGFFSSKASRLYVEIKSPRPKDSARELARTVVSRIADHKLEDRTTVLSFDLAALEEVKRLNPELSIGILFKPRVGHTLALKKMLAMATHYGASEIGLHRLLATRRVVRSAIEQNLRVTVWTVNNPKWIIRGRTWGIHALITNDPAGIIGSADTP